MTNKDKLEALKTFLKENKIQFYPHFRGILKVTPDLYIPKHKIMVKLSEGVELDNVFFRTVKHKYRPLFIRDAETADFVVEKMQNLIIDIMRQKQLLYEKLCKKNKQRNIASQLN